MFDTLTMRRTTSHYSENIGKNEPRLISGYQDTCVRHTIHTESHSSHSILRILRTTAIFNNEIELNEKIQQIQNHSM